MDIQVPVVLHLCNDAVPTAEYVAVNTIRLEPYE